MNWQSTPYQFLLAGNYPEVAKFYEQAIEEQPTEITNYLYLGLAYLLQEQEEEAQSIWLSLFTQGSEEEIEQWIQDLAIILFQEAYRQEQSQNYLLAWLIRNHIREINPAEINNLLFLILLEIKLEKFELPVLYEWKVIDIINQAPINSLNRDLLIEVLNKILLIPNIVSINFAEAILNQTNNAELFINKIMQAGIHMAYERNYIYYGVDINKLCLNRQPNNLFLLKNLFWLYSLAHKFKEGLEVGEEFYAKCNNSALKLFGNYQLLYIYMGRADWLNLEPLTTRHMELIQDLITEKPFVSEDFVREAFIIAGQPLLYLKDKPAENRALINTISGIFQENQLQSLKIPPVEFKAKPRPVKIGYIGHTLRTHSVGWLSRWLIHHHDREKFQIAIYMVEKKEDEVTQEWFKSKVDIFHSFSRNVITIAEQIQKDEIDILVDVDSLTMNITCQVMALKPAPIQVTWLGLDASGLPAIDYFIADPYVLPENAQDYYKEKIWRLPQTYLAIDGFEVGVPTLRREDLEIPSDAIIYFNMQNALKRHPDTIRLQMQILKAVSNSYLLIKGSGDEDIVKNFFTQLAKEGGVDPSRLRFLAKDPTETIHRANLNIADVVLDTYPYNGATTTLEVLWMGIPLVTRVGEQFAARNSYTFMKNVGITEGLAYNEAEYVEWGIKFGLDESLRQQVAWKMRCSRHTSPLWNAQQFTRQMEKAYQQMWEKRLKGEG